jgi:predicted transcriptional regulator
MEDVNLINLTADIVAAHVSNNSVGVGDLRKVIHEVHDALLELGEAREIEPEAKTPVVSIRASVKPDYLICLECGRKQKTLKRHLRMTHGISAEQYRADYGLPNDYPLVAPNYSKQRGDMARALGLGRTTSRWTKGTKEALPATEPKRGRPRAAGKRQG